QDGQSGVDSGVQESAKHLCRHPRASDREPARVGSYADARRDRAGVVQGDRCGVVALHQSVPCNVGTERLPSHVPAMLGMCPGHHVSPRRGHEDVTTAGCPHDEGHCMNRRAILALVLACAWLPLDAAQLPPRPPKPIPVVVVETSKGTFAFETYPNEAPKTVAHIVGLVQKGFYDGQRVHRAMPGFLVQFGDPQTRDLSLRDRWGKGAAASSGTPIGIAEISKKRLHTAGAVGIAHMGNPAKGDSQIYITLAPRRDLDGQYAVFGHVIEGEDVPAQLQVGDEIRRVYVR